MDFYEDEPQPPGDLEDWDDDDDYSEVDFAVTDCVEVFGQLVFDIPTIFEPDAVVVMVKGYWGDSEQPSLLFRASGNLAPYEIQAILAEGIRETLGQ